MSPTPIRRVLHLRGYAAEQDSGFTVLESVVAATLFVIVASATALAIVGNTTSSRLSQQRVKAASIAQSFLASIQSARTIPATLPTKGPGGYAVRMTLNPTTATCTPGTVRRVSVLVFAPDASTTGTPTARTDAVIAC